MSCPFLSHNGSQIKKKNTVHSQS